MEDTKTFADAIEAFGGIAAVARALDETLQTVSNWRARGVPPNRCKAVEKLLGISVKRLRPDDWADYWPDEQSADAPAVGATRAESIVETKAA